MKRTLAAAAALSLAVTLAPLSSASARGNPTVAENDGAVTISMACTNPGPVKRVKRGDWRKCSGNTVWLRVAKCRNLEHEVSTLGLPHWTTWRTVTGWHAWSEEPGAVHFFRQVADGTGC